MAFFSFLSSLPISVLRNLELEQTNYIKQHSLPGVMFNISIQLYIFPYIDSEVNHNDILSKFHSLLKVLSLLIYIVSSRTI